MVVPPPWSTSSLSAAAHAQARGLFVLPLRLPLRLRTGVNSGSDSPRNSAAGRPVSLLAASGYNLWASRSVVQIHSPRLRTATT
jgi:hypothetical protein